MASQGDPALLRAAGAMNRDAMTDPDLAQQMPPTLSHWQFMGSVFAELKKQAQLIG